LRGFRSNSAAQGGQHDQFFILVRQFGKIDAPEFRSKGKDEIAILAGSFNRMRTSLVQAMKMLEE